MNSFYNYIDDNIYFIMPATYDNNRYAMKINEEWIDINKQEYEYIILWQDIIWGFINIKMDHCE